MPLPYAVGWIALVIAMEAMEKLLLLRLVIEGLGQSRLEKEFLLAEGGPKLIDPDSLIVIFSEEGLEDPVRVSRLNHPEDDDSLAIHGADANDFDLTRRA